MEDEMKEDARLDLYLANKKKERGPVEVMAKAILPVFNPNPLLEMDPNGKSPNLPGAKLDSGKVRPWLCIAGFSRALNEVARVTTKGAEKYTPNGWAEVPDGANRYMEAFGRHLLAYGEGKVFDDGPNGLGSDIYHKAQMVWNLLASLELELREKNDNN